MQPATLICPHCHLAAGIGTAAVFDHVFITKRCQNCRREILIVKGVPITFEDYSRKGEA